MNAAMQLEFAADGRSGSVSRDGRTFAAAVEGFGGYPLISLRDDDVPARGDIRSEGLWASITCETRGEHWSVQMEAFATGYDDPASEADGRGDVVALGFDLEWTRDGDSWRVEGDVLVGDDRYWIDATGSVAE